MAPASPETLPDDTEFDLDVRLHALAPRHSYEPTEPSPATQSCACPPTSLTRCVAGLDDG
jgi:hypothetical protein